MTTTKLYNIEVGEPMDPIARAEYVEWLREQGHEVTVDDVSHDTRINGLSVNASENASEISNRLWDSYCITPSPTRWRHIRSRGSECQGCGASGVHVDTDCGEIVVGGRVVASVHDLPALMGSDGGELLCEDCHEKEDS